MRVTRRRLLAAALAAPAIGRAWANDARLEDLARRAAIYLFPVYEMYRTRWTATADERNPTRQKLNRFVHTRALATPGSRSATIPEVDTLVSSAWLDLSIEPVFLTLPDMGGRSYSFALINLFSDTFAQVCRRLDGNRPRPRMIVGPSWEGVADRDVVLVRAPTNGVWLVGRVAVDGAPDLEPVRALQSRTLLESPDMRNERRILETEELMRQRSSLPPEPVADWEPIHPADPFDLFEVGMRALGESPLAERDKAAIEEFAALRLRPGRKFDLRAFSKSERETIERGIARGRDEIAAARRGTTVDGWLYPERHLGNFGDDYVYRAVVARGGLAAPQPAESTWLTCSRDSEGRPLDGRQRYVLRFEAGQPPPVRAFWSLTAYEVTPEGHVSLVDNPLGRYAIGDRSHGLVRGADGSLELSLQHARPERVSNWLPAPAGPMRLVLRAYEPDERLLDGSWRAPAVRRVG